MNRDSQEDMDELWEKVTADGGSDDDPEKSKRVMAAVLQMRKIDIAALERAYAGRD